MIDRSFCGVTSILLTLCLGLVGPLPALGQAPVTLVSGELLEGSISWEGPTLFGFSAETAGVLTVVVRAADEADLFLLVTDADGQPLPEGRSDQDLGGDAGAEQFAVTLPRAGSYQVRVETFGGGEGSFKIGVSWLPFPGLAVPADPDGSPSSATRIRVGQETRSDAIDGAKGDYWDWFVLKAEKGGTLTVTTRAEEGDLILEAFTPGEYAEALERSDQDLQGNSGNEAVTLIAEAGEEFYFKVSAFSAGASVPYRLQVGFIPN
ncbi:MAG: hypothetical protein HKO65_01825 [Gemmatimonadetes bacterium]|nr:hypothetical protein [Gemmatimonadota bacterium]NNM03814.1 hypothetical protein [Gemmatimonadota bacterium]